MKNFKAYLTEGPTGVTPNEIKADQDRVKKAQDWNRKETQRQANNVPAPGVYSPGDDEGPTAPRSRELPKEQKKLKEGKADNAFDELEKEKEGKSVPVEPKRASEIQGKSTKVKDMNPLDRAQWEKEKKEAQIKEEQLDEKLIRVRNVRSGATRTVSSVFRKIYKKQGWNAVQGTRG